MTPGAIADGYLTASNPYDGYMYVFGKGQSATTVTASPETRSTRTSSANQRYSYGSISSSAKHTMCFQRLNGVWRWNTYTWQMPITGLWGNETITGVPVTLTAIGSDGSVTDIGTTTTNGYYGTFAYAWTPPKEGIYTIMASFAGDDSYGSSSAATASQ